MTIVTKLLGSLTHHVNITNSRRKRRRSPVISPAAVESLEDRRLLSATTSIVVGILTIEAGDSPADIKVRKENRGRLAVYDGDQLLRRINLRSQPIQRISFVGGAGHDVFDASSVSIAVRAEGGGGNDILIGGRGRDELFGGDGHDQLYGGAGSDRLYGGTGRDFLDGGQFSDFDLLSGDAGADTFRQDLYYSRGWGGWSSFRGGNSFTLINRDYALDFTVEDQYGDTPPVIPPDSDPPVAVDDVFEVNEDNILVVRGAGVLANDTDPNGDTLTASLVDRPANGSVNLNSDGTFTYTPRADFSGTDHFTYRVTDGFDYGNATVTITVNSVADAPVSAAESYTVDQDRVLTISSAGVLTNDTDADGDVLTAILVDDVAHGTLVLNADGSFTYTPQAGYFGSDHFTYVADDGSLQSEVTTVHIDVRPFASSNINVSLDAEGTLSIIGDIHDNNVEVTVIDAQIVVYGLDTDNARQRVLGTFHTSVVQAVYFEGQAGNDRLDASTLAVPVTAFGGAGNDILIGGTANDRLIGDDSEFTNPWWFRASDGRDELHGGAGHDRLFGGGNYDSLYGDDGDDYLDGGHDNDFDRLFGGSGADSFVKDWSQCWFCYNTPSYNIDRPLDFNALERDRYV